MAALAGLAVAAGAARAQEHDVDALAKKTQNPVSELISVPFQNNFNFRLGPFDRTQYLLNVQPVVPVALGEDWSVKLRPIVPILSQPVARSDRTFGMGDIQLEMFFSPRKPGSVVWGVGPIFTFPTRTDAVLGNGMWGAGPAAVLVHMHGPWVYGALMNHSWSIGHAGARESRFSLTTLQPFVNYNFGGGLALGFQSTTTIDWLARSRDTWTVPLGLSLTKTFVVGHQPMSLGGGAFYNVARATNGAAWQLRLQYTLIFPTGKP